MTDPMTLEQVLWHIHNWFVRSTITVKNCSIENGELPESVAGALLEGQWYRIQGSILNDGLHRHIAEDLEDETFDGEIDTLVIPKALLAVVDEIQDYIDNNSAALQTAQQSPYQSESFGGYTYSIRSDLTAQNGSGGLTGWQAMFAARLSPWRKIS